MSFKLGKKSLRRLVGVHPLLAFAVYEALKISKIDFGVTEGVRTMKRQRKLVRQKRSKTLKSYHLNGLAVDIVPFINGNYRWDNEAAFREISRVMNIVIKKYRLNEIQNGFALWGWDNPHWQMTGMRKKYDIRAIDAIRFPG